MELPNYTFNFLTAVTYRRCDSNFVKPQIVLLQWESSVKQADLLMLQLKLCDDCTDRMDNIFV